MKIRHTFPYYSIDLIQGRIEGYLIEIKFDIQLDVELFEFLDDLQTSFTDKTVLAIEQQAVVEAPLDVVNDLLHLEIVVVIQPLVDRPEVDGLLYDFEIVRDLQSIWINRVMEYSGRIDSPKTIDQPLSSFIPAVIQWSICVA